MSIDEIDVLAMQDEYNIPLDISDLLIICQEYSQLGWSIQNQINAIMENGLVEAVKSGAVKREALPHIKTFLKAIYRNPLFGDASFQAQEVMVMLDNYQDAINGSELN